MDYSVNVRAVLASFYIGTGGMDIGLVNSCQGIAGGKSWEKTFYNHSPKICKGIINVVNATLDANLKEQIDLTIEEKLEDKYSASEIASLTRKYHAKIKTGIHEVDNVLISLSFDIGWQKRGHGILTIAYLDTHTILVYEEERSFAILCTRRNAVFVTFLLQWVKSLNSTMIAPVII